MSKPSVRGAIEREGKYFCEGCDNDLSVAGSVQFVAHGDGPKHYFNTYNCNKCGNPVTMKFERSKEDAAYWE